MPNEQIGDSSQGQEANGDDAEFGFDDDESLAGAAAHLKPHLPLMDLVGAAFRHVQPMHSRELPLDIDFSRIGRALELSSAPFDDVRELVQDGLLVEQNGGWSVAFDAIVSERLVDEVKDPSSMDGEAA